MTMLLPIQSAPDSAIHTGQPALTCAASILFVVLKFADIFFAIWPCNCHPVSQHQPASASAIHTGQPALTDAASMPFVALKFAVVISAIWRSRCPPSE